MKTKQEWLKILGETRNDQEELDVIDRIQQDAQPKLVTGSVAKEWPENTWLLCQIKDDKVFLTLGQLKNFSHSTGLASTRFLRIDEILAQPWPDKLND